MVCIQNIRYADDKVLLARSKADLENLLYILKEESEIRGLNINKKKTKLMVFSKNKIPPKCKSTLDDEELQQVENFSYLGSILTQDCRCSSDINTRIVLAKKSPLQMCQAERRDVGAEEDRGKISFRVWRWKQV
ncbi:uncharacterized protein [Penaeus vannamei]|uniref:uncharacterized protein n=1 Tax=Penaeus vannamei TaxID=6689 RepID=UPI00387F79BE